MFITDSAFVVGVASAGMEVARGERTGNIITSKRKIIASNKPMPIYYLELGGAVAVTMGRMIGKVIHLANLPRNERHCSRSLGLYS